MSVEKQTLMAEDETKCPYKARSGLASSMSSLDREKAETYGRTVGKYYASRTIRKTNVLLSTNQEVPPGAVLI